MTDAERALDAIEYLTGERPENVDETVLADAGRVLLGLDLTERDPVTLDGYPRVLGPDIDGKEDADVYFALAVREDDDVLDALIGVQGSKATLPVASWDLDWALPEEVIAYELEDARRRAVSFVDAFDANPSRLKKLLEQVDDYIILTADGVDEVIDATPQIPTDARKPPLRITRNYGQDNPREQLTAAATCLFGREAETTAELIVARWLAQYSWESGWHAAKMMVRAQDDPSVKGTFAQVDGMWCLARNADGSARTMAAVIPFTFTDEDGKTHPTLVGAMVGPKACTIYSNRVYGQDDVPLTVVVDLLARLANSVAEDVLPSALEGADTRPPALLY